MCSVKYLIKSFVSDFPDVVSCSITWELCFQKVYNTSSPFISEGPAILFVLGKLLKS